MRLSIFLLFIATYVECKGKDYYKILKITPKASLPEIKKSFRDLAKFYHPDKNSSPGANQKFTEIQEAYDVLKSEKTRELYDESRAGGYDFNPNSAAGGNGFRPGFFRGGVKPFKFNFGSLFDDLAGAGGAAGGAGGFQGFGGFGGFPFGDFFKDFEPAGGMPLNTGSKKNRGGGGGMKCKTTVKKVGSMTTTITQCS